MNERDIKPYNNKNKAHGLWIYYLSDGILWYKGYWINNKQYGYWIDNRFINVNYKSEITFYLK